MLLLAAAPGGVQDPAERNAYPELVRPFFEAHCVRCHNPEKKKGKFSLHGLGGDVNAERAAYAAVLERLKAGDMPPDGEPKPEQARVDRVSSWIVRGMSAASGAVVSAPAAGPAEGNATPHALLFGVPPGPSVPPPPRLWRLGPGAYSEGFVRELRSRHGKDLAQPFSLVPDPGIRDYADLYFIDGAAAEVLIRNAERLVEGQTMHELVPDGKGVRVQMAHDTVREFAPLLHPEAAPTPEQLAAAVRAQIRMALAREPEPGEVHRLIDLYERNVKLADRPAAARAMLMAPLLVPEATHRFEVGRGAAIRPGVRMLSPHEIAFALSLALSDRREPGLFAGAAKGGLTTREDVAAQARRILDDPKFPKPRLLGFFREYFGYDRATEVFKDRPADVLFRPDQMVKDTDRLVLAVLEKDRDVLRELLTTPVSFVNWAGPKEDKKTKQTVLKRAVEAHPINDKGRKHPEAAYGFDEWPERQPVELPGDRIGILQQPSWLVAWSGNFENDPVRRGRWIRERLLGGRVPDLPLGIAAKVPDEPEQPLRHRLRVTREAACWTCHRTMDDLGLPFEGFDHYGKARTAEAVLDPEATARNVDRKGKPLGPVHRGAPLATSGAILASGDPGLDGPVANASELLRKLAGSGRVRQVFVRHVFRYLMGRNESAGDAASLQEADRAYVESGGSFKALLVSLLSSESFLYRSVPK
jgi:hypothetical protein